MKKIEIKWSGNNNDSLGMVFEFFFTIHAIQLHCENHRYFLIRAWKNFI